jgi:mono/diheme cytochrome c family protein
MQRTLVPGRCVSLALLFALAALNGCGEQAPFTAPPGHELNVSPVPPPPISGGTLIITRADVAVAADPDRDKVWITALKEDATPRSIGLEDHDEPGRLVEDGAGKVHVALRRGGAIVTIDPVNAKIVERRPVCAAPRGIAYDKDQDLLHVACEDGELVSLPAQGGEATRRLRLARDLRDVIVDGDRLLVSRFRAAELLIVDKDGKASAPLTLPSFEPEALFGGTPGLRYEPAVAWRTVRMPTGGALMLHQRAMAVPVTLSPGGYYQTSGCDGSILHAAVSVFRSPAGLPKGPTESLASDAFSSVALPVDVAVAPDGEQIAIVGAGSDVLVQTQTSFLEKQAGSKNCNAAKEVGGIPGEPVAVAFNSRGNIIVQTRAPAIVMLRPGSAMATINLPGESRADSGHEMFHRPPNGFSGIACASCHPEGHDDGRTWTFTTPEGGGFVRRTQNIGIGGGLLETAPFHWNGDLKDLGALMDEVFVLRMGGTAPGPRKVQLFSNWLDQLPAMPPSLSGDEAAITRGKELFESAAVGCGTCHTGARLTNNKTADVGTGAQFQVPSLISVGSRAPLMHDGCAKSLRERFTNPTCAGGDKHGTTSQLTAAEIDDLTSYLESL